MTYTAFSENEDKIGSKYNYNDCLTNKALDVSKEPLEFLSMNNIKTELSTEICNTVDNEIKIEDENNVNNINIEGYILATLVKLAKQKIITLSLNINKCKLYTAAF